MLRDTNGEWVDDSLKIQNMINDYYQNLFSKPSDVWNWHQTELTFPRLEEDCVQHLNRPIEAEEVRSALFSMSPWKAPGPDGYPAGFYQQAWDIIKPSVFEFVSQVWMNPCLLDEVNYTDICLIPKVAQPEYVNQFRPISLCNTLYKIVSKVVVSRLKEYISILVSPFQTGFIPGRSIHENIVVAQEVVHSMQRVSGARGYFAIKVDLAKAYDMLRWDFIHSTLQEIGLPLNMVRVIMQGISSVKTNVNWHGSRAPYFSPNRGIRQGDPMSPYIFVICMDKLSHLISQSVNKGEWKGIKAGRSGPTISHLMFADDLLLFGEANGDQMNCVMRVLNEFCNISGQKVSIEKTSILFSKNVTLETRATLQLISGFRVTSSLGKYLGVPLNGKAPKREDFHYIITRLQNKLATWKASNLSFAGRVTLAKSVMEAIPIYPMMTTIIPKSIVKEAQRLQRSFIWGDSLGGKHYHAVSWYKVTQPKRMGGLGLRRLDIMNRSCITKLGWELQQGNPGMWSAVLRGKYGRGITTLTNVVAKSSDSSLWKGLVACIPWIVEHACVTIGDGKSTNAWERCWIAPNMRISELGITIPNQLKDAVVADLTTNDNTWNWDALSWLPKSVLNRLIAIPPPEHCNGDDTMFWPYEKHGKFSISSTYDLLADFESSADELIWKKIWKLQIPERVRSFVWLMKHDRLLTNYRKSKMHLSSPYCSFCGDRIETELHVLRDCSKCMNVWLNIVGDNGREQFFNSNLQQWIYLNINGNIQGIEIDNWQNYWAHACHSLWTWRNKEIHDESFVRPVDPKKQIIKRMKDYVDCSKINSVVSLMERVNQEVGWSPLNDDWVVLNTDGAKHHDNRSGCGGILRTGGGTWIGGFSQELGECSIVVAELYMGCMDWFEVCLGSRIPVEMQLDAQGVVYALKKNSVHRSLCRKTWRLLELDWEVYIATFIGRSIFVRMFLLT
jgi:hypothetical protein